MNANQRHDEALSTSDRIALWITSHVGTMYCAGLFSLIGVGSIVGLLTNNTLLGLACGAFSSYFLQLVLLPIIMVGQNIQSKHAEHIADATYEDAEGIKKMLTTLLEIHR